MKLDPRYRIVSRADAEIRIELSAVLDVLEISWVDILYHIAMIKAVLLTEMGATTAPRIKSEDIPDNHHVIASAFYRYLMQYELTNAELYHIITEWELREARGMIRAERNEDIED